MRLAFRDACRAPAPDMDADPGLPPRRGKRYGREARVGVDCCTLGLACNWNRDCALKTGRGAIAEPPLSRAEPTRLRVAVGAR